MQRRMPITTYSTVLEKVRHDQSLLIIRCNIDYDMTSLGKIEVGLSWEKIALRRAELGAELERELRDTAIFTGGAILLSLSVLILLIRRWWGRAISKSRT